MLQGPREDMEDVLENEECSGETVLVVKSQLIVSLFSENVFVLEVCSIDKLTNDRIW